MNEWTQLTEYIEKLLKDGKRSQHEDFQVLFRVFGEKRITQMAKDILKKEKNVQTQQE